METLYQGFDLDDELVDGPPLGLSDSDEIEVLRTDHTQAILDPFLDLAENDAIAGMNQKPLVNRGYRIALATSPHRGGPLCLSHASLVGALQTHHRIYRHRRSPCS